MGLEDRLIIELTGKARVERPPAVAGADWEKIFRRGRANRLSGAVFAGLVRAGLLSFLPQDVRQGFEDGYLRQVTAIRFALACPPVLPLVSPPPGFLCFSSGGRPSV